MSDSERFKKLPDRVPVEDMVEVVQAEAPPEEDAMDPNREVAWRWGAGIAPGL
jgi:hypothetical protein